MRFVGRAIAVTILAVAGVLGTAQAEGQPGEFDYYALALSWSPAYCEGQGRNDRGPQCNGSRSYAFVLHGLWPQYNRGWPQDCRTRERPWVPEPLIDRMLDIMPSPKLVIHEYKKHGTCSGLAPDAYFDLARKLYTKINVPERFRAPTTSVSVSLSEVEEEFLKANPGLKPNMFRVVCQNRRLSEIRFCFGRDEKPMPCGANEDHRKLCPLDNVIMPPVRIRR